MSSVRFGRWTHGLQPLRVTGSEYAQLPLVHAVATVKIDRGPQCKNTKPGCNRKIQSQARVVNGIAALVTTALRCVVTRTLAHGIRHARLLPVTPAAFEKLGRTSGRPRLLHCNNLSKFDLSIHIANTRCSHQLSISYITILKSMV